MLTLETYKFKMDPGTQHGNWNIALKLNEM